MLMQGFQFQQFLLSLSILLIEFETCVALHTLFKSSKLQYHHAEKGTDSSV